MGLYGPLRTSTRIHRPLAGLYGPLRASTGLTWASHGQLRASTGFSRLLMGLYWIVSHVFFSFSFFSLATQIPLLQWGGLGGGVGAVLLQLEICLVGHTVLGAGWSP